MKVHELRIGNYVKAKYEDEASDDYVDVICEIDGIDGCGFSEHMYWLHPIEGESREEYYEVGPIPLIEQWLIDFGFEKNWDTYRLGNFEIANLTNGLGEKSFSILIGYECVFTEFFYVHQLQNLYFALTGKELTKQ